MLVYKGVANHFDKTSQIVRIQQNITYYNQDENIFPTAATVITFLIYKDSRNLHLSTKADVQVTQGESSILPGIFLILPIWLTY